MNKHMIIRLGYAVIGFMIGVLLIPVVPLIAACFLYNEYEGEGEKV